MPTQLLTKEQIDAHLEKLDRKIKELETSNILDTIKDEPKRIQEPPRTQSKELETGDILDIIEEPKRTNGVTRNSIKRVRNQRYTGHN